MPYVFEGLIVELASMFMYAYASLNNILQNAAYLDSWVNALEADTQAIFRAKSQGCKATNDL